MKRYRYRSELCRNFFIEQTNMLSWLLASIIVVLLHSHLNAQQFTRITNAGPIVTRMAGSFSSSWGDVNGDGWMDIHVIENPTSSLHLNNGDGTFASITTGHLVNFNGFQNSAVWGDYDNDGYLDLYVSSLGPGTPIPPGDPLNPRLNYLYRNEGPPNYTLTRMQINALDADSNMTWTSTWADYDNDGDIDLFVPGDQGDIDIFYQNDGGGSFSQLTALPFINPGEFSAGGSWVDMDNDGDEDLLIVNFMSANNELYRNMLAETGSLDFQQITSGSIVQDFEDDLVPSWGDYDNDGDLDAFMAAWYNKNNLLFRNDGDLNFTRITSGIVVNDQGWTLGNTWLDYDNDGYLDLFIIDTQSSNRLYRNNGNGTFTKMTSQVVGDLLTAHGSTSGCSVADYDNDGDMDIFIPVGGGQNRLYRNEVGSNNNWLTITCVGTVSNKSAIGAKIRAKAAISSSTPDEWQMRYVLGGPTGDRAQNSQRAHFGLGDAAVVDSLIIEWPSGLVEIFTGLSPNQFITATENQGITALQDNNPQQPQIPREFALHQNYPNPFNPSTNLRFAISDLGFVELEVFDVSGWKVITLVSKELPPGEYEVQWDGRDDSGQTVSTGLYIYRLQSGGFTQSRKMLLVR